MAQLPAQSVLISGCAMLSGAGHAAQCAPKNIRADRLLLRACVQVNVPDRVVNSDHRTQLQRIVASAAQKPGSRLKS